MFRASITTQNIQKLTVGYGRVYAAFLDDLDKRIKQGQDPKCFARDMADLAVKYGFDDAQKYFCGRLVLYFV